MRLAAAACSRPDRRLSAAAVARTSAGPVSGSNRQRAVGADAGDSVFQDREGPRQPPRADQRHAGDTDDDHPHPADKNRPTAGRRWTVVQRHDDVVGGSNGDGEREGRRVRVAANFSGDGRAALRQRAPQCRRERLDEVTCRPRRDRHRVR
jgi:hypothetical protein